MRGRSLRAGDRKVTVLFLIGLAAGILLMNIGESILLYGTGLFDEDTLYRMKYMSVDGDALFCYVLRKRMVFFIAFSLIATTYLGYAACVAVLLWGGASAGIYLSALILRYGLKGIILAAVAVFPQFLFYIPAFLLMLSWSGSLYRNIYGAGKNSNGEKSFPVAAMLRRLAVIALLLFFGCLTEGYVNPALLTGYLKIF